MRTSRSLLAGLMVILPGTALLPGPDLSAQATGIFPHGTFPEGVGCLDCHTTEGWRPIQEDPVFDHEEITGFPLVGRHAAASCRACHEDLHFEKAEASPEECGTCHLDVHSGSLSTNCSLCHTPTSYRDVSGLQIHQTTAFLLEGAHLQISCESCHSSDEGGSFRPLPTECMACHREDFEAPKEIDHVSLGFPAECLTCHTPRAWMDIGAFDHAVFSGGFRLQGAHQRTQCNACHVQGGGLRFSPSGQEDCAACHQADYQREHAGSGYPQTCTLCHGQGTWDREDFDHPQVSGGYVLAGAHEEMACTNCHTPDGTGVLFNPSDPNDCVACHQADYQEEHSGSGYPTSCLSCHTVNTWDGATADHMALSDGFELVGDHGELTCTSCHTPDGSGTLFEPTAPDDCVACHQADFQQEHAGSGYPSSCLSCHQVTTWDGATTDHATLSGGFELVGNHGELVCTSCHTPDGSGTLFNPSASDDCVACHQADFQREHSGSGYPTSCLDCHTITTWDGATADHGEVSGGFDLMGNHTLLPCISCHITGGTGLLFDPATPDDCIACHQVDYQQEHSGSGYPTTCLICHTIDTWDGASPDHSALSGGFGLVGNHNLLPCASCHVLPGMETLFTPSNPEDCLACHLGDFQREHSGSGYPTSCLSCHVVTTWGGAQFDHDGDFFPIYSGKHQGEWASCQTCHTSPSDYRVFTCFNCHKHNKTDTDKDHSEVSGYDWVSALCLSCHLNPTGTS